MEYTRSPRRASRTQKEGTEDQPEWRAREEALQEESPERQQRHREKVAQSQDDSSTQGTWSVGPEAEETSDRMSWGKRGPGWESTLCGSSYTAFC